jgi:phospholipase C
VDEPAHPRWRLTRRGLLKRGGALGAALTVPGVRSAIVSASAMAATRVPDSLPDPTRPAGTATAAMPFDHVVCVMMEKHSFDNLLGALPRLGQSKADGLTFDSAGQATNSNPSSSGYGEAWAYQILQAVLDSPAWSRTLLTYTYDEHGGYYDHVPPPAAIAPDSIPPDLSPGDAPGATTCTAPASPESSSRRTRSRTGSPTCFTTTPRCWRRSRRSGTCRR